MIALINGSLIYKSISHVIVEANGIEIGRAHV
jgi:Holliday junction resolvasome RuvABC DNA-binding subunit